MSERPPGWYRDPDHSTGHRYWNGEKWAEDGKDDVEGARGPASAGAP